MSVEQSLDQGFNDAELEDIMNEIENLEQEVASGVEDHSMSNKLETKKDATVVTENVVQKEEAKVKMDSAPIQDTVNDLEENGLQQEQVAMVSSVKADENTEVESNLDNLANLETEPTKSLQNTIDDEIAQNQKILEKELEQKSTQQEKNNMNIQGQRGNLDLGHSPSQLDFTVSGHMSMNLCFHISGQKVNLRLDGSHDFVIELESGARFTIPLGKR